MTPKHADEIIKQHKSVVAMAESEIEIQCFDGIICSLWKERNWVKTYHMLDGMFCVAEGSLERELDFLSDVATELSCATN